MAFLLRFYANFRLELIYQPFATVCHPLRKDLYCYSISLDQPLLEAYAETSTIPRLHLVLTIAPIQGRFPSLVLLLFVSLFKVLKPRQSVPPGKHESINQN